MFYYASAFNQNINGWKINPNPGAARFVSLYK